MPWSEMTFTVKYRLEYPGDENEEYLYKDNGKILLWKLCSFIDAHVGPGFLKKDCLYFYKEGLQNISDKKKCAKLLKLHENKITAHLVRSDMLQNRLKLLANTARSANSTLYTTFTQADVSVSCYKTPEKQITTDHDILPIGPNPFIVESSQEKKHED
ncbi:2983_t:CDS:2 [Ambispora leptoticha]|uniref:2983_t:CDS:1 n=1 Tax=Ambispora leptoticha TaxID=144679 RepID=A0A9N9DEF0_9GLOM|nr:2983_t:CDS:2 [Ambispora leptoticha]